MSKKYGYIITGLRNVIAICENDNKEVYLGNNNIKIFDNKEDTKKFMKTKDFKILDNICPCEWHIIKIIKRERK